MPLSLLRPRPPLARLTALALLLGLGLPATPVLAGPDGGRLSPEQAARIFPDRRDLALRDHRARIAILERSERCISAAADGDALRRCLREERNASMRQRRQMVEAMRDLHRRNGLPVPD